MGSAVLTHPTFFWAAWEIPAFVGMTARQEKRVSEVAAYRLSKMDCFASLAMTAF